MQQHVQWRQLEDNMGKWRLKNRIDFIFLFYFFVPLKYTSFNPPDMSSGKLNSLWLKEECKRTRQIVMSTPGAQGQLQNIWFCALRKEKHAEMTAENQCPFWDSSCTANHVPRFTTYVQWTLHMVSNKNKIK